MRGDLKDAIQELFKDDHEIALFYFAGHGHITGTGGYILASDSSRGDEGVPLTEVLTLAEKSDAKNRIILLDSCHAGIAGAPPGASNLALLSEGMTVLTASTAAQYAAENAQGGVFTSLLVDALSGPAANLVGDITPGGVYAHIDQALGPWEQRPVFKTNVKTFVSVRKVQAPIPLAELRRITEFFPQPGAEFRLDPTFEPDNIGRTPGMPPPNPENNRTFAILQRYRSLNLLVPIGAPHLWHAAMQSKSCKLTVVGEHWRRLVAKGLI